MQELEKLISIYHTAYIVCLILAAVFFVVSIVLFFRFDIKRIFDMKSGRGMKRTVRKMKEVNAQTGRLRTGMTGMTGSTPPVLQGAERITYPVTANNLEVHEQAGKAAEEQSTETELLYESSETTLLAAQGGTNVQQPDIQLPGTFKIEKEILWIHTEEVL